MQKISKLFILKAYLVFGALIYIPSAQAEYYIVYPQVQSSCAAYCLYPIKKHYVAQYKKKSYKHPGNYSTKKNSYTINVYYYFPYAVYPNSCKNNCLTTYRTNCITDTYPTTVQNGVEEDDYGSDLRTADDVGVDTNN